MRICTALKQQTQSDGTTVLQAKWMKLVVDASGALVPGSESDWQVVPTFPYHVVELEPVSRPAGGAP